MSARASLALAALLAALLAVPAVPALAAGIEDCEAIANALAYNQCLARYGPVRGARAARGTPAPEGADEPKGQEAPVARGRTDRRGRLIPAAPSGPVVVGRGGRRTIVLDVGPGPRARAVPARPAKRSWRRRR